MKNNKLILEFLGRKGKFFSNLYTFKGLYGLIGDTWIGADNAKFDSSWDWLMIVVEKIESIKCHINGRIGVYISSNTCTIQSTKLFQGDSSDKYYNESTLETKIKSTYDAVVKFIKYYNNLNK